MSPFQNSNTWRNQQEHQENSYSDGARAQQNPCADSQTTQNAPFSGSAGTQDSAPGQNWMENPALAGIDPSRLQMLSSLAAQAQGKNQNELLPFLMAAASQSNTGGLSFNPEEIDAIINVMKIGKSPQEIQQIDRICTLMRQFGAMRGPNRR